MAKVKKEKKKEGIKNYVGKPIAQKQFKRFLAGAKTPAERAAIKSMILGDELQYFGKEEAVEATAKEA